MVKDLMTVKRVVNHQVVRKKHRNPTFLFLASFHFVHFVAVFLRWVFFAKSFLKYKGGRARPANNTCMIFQRKTHRSGSVKIAPSAATAVGVALGNKSRDNEVI